MQKIAILIKQNFGVSVLRFLILTLFSFCFFTSTSLYAQQQDNTKPLRVAVAANFTPVLKVLLQDFTLQTGIKTQIISGASGAMFLQIKHGAPFDIFLSADSRRPKELELSGYVLTNSRKTYATGQLALYSSTLTSLEQLVDNLQKKPPQLFAIANPDIAPYGKAAREALTHLGVWKAQQNKLIKGINIGQTFSQIRTNAVSSGIVANSQLVLNNLSGVIIPSSYHQPIEQQLVILKTSKQQNSAKKLSEFLLLAKQQQIIVSYGYAPSPQVK